MLFLLNIYKHKGSMVAILDFTMAAMDTNKWYKVKNVSSAIVDLKNVCLDTKLMFPLYLGAEICE